MSSTRLLFIVMTCWFGMANVVFAQASVCGELKNFGDVGPWDYADPSSSAPTGADPMGRIKRVENVHFKPEVRNLNTKVMSIEGLTGELVYTLRIFPNHPEALYAISRLEKAAGGTLPQKSATIFTPRVSAACFFDRAIRFRPDDKAVRMTYGMHFHLRGRFNEALEQYKKAESLGEESPSFNYNLGLLYADMKNWSKAQEYAQKAYDSGLDLRALKQKVEQAGYKIKIPERTTEVKETAVPDPAESLGHRQE